MRYRFTPDEIARLAAVVSVPLPVDDLAAVAEALTAQARDVEPLLRGVADDDAPWLAPHPRWDG